LSRTGEGDVVANRDELTLEGELRRLLDADPFGAFAISVSSGERFDIELPDRLIIGPNVATLFDPAGGSVVIRKNQIVTLDTRGGR
jgi:hypothetical protein